MQYPTELKLELNLLCEKRKVLLFNSRLTLSRFVRVERQ